MVLEQDLGVLSYIVELIQEQFGDPEDPANWSQVINDFIHQIIQELDFKKRALCYGLKQCLKMILELKF